MLAAGVRGRGSRAVCGVRRVRSAGAAMHACCHRSAAETRTWGFSQWPDGRYLGGPYHVVPHGSHAGDQLPPTAPLPPPLPSPPDTHADTALPVTAARQYGLHHPSQHCRMQRSHGKWQQLCCQAAGCHPTQGRKLGVGVGPGWPSSCGPSRERRISPKSCSVM
jgi:hypothetical protein